MDLPDTVLPGTEPPGRCALGASVNEAVLCCSSARIHVIRGFVYAGRRPQVSNYTIRLGGESHAEQRPVPSAQYGAGNVPVHVTPIGARSIEHRWVKILFGLAREAQSLSRIACAESLALIAQ
jgi:hypothetical protein